MRFPLMLRATHEAERNEANARAALERVALTERALLAEATADGLRNELARLTTMLAKEQTRVGRLVRQLVRLRLAGAQPAPEKTPPPKAPDPSPEERALATERAPYVARIAARLREETQVSAAAAEAEAQRIVRELEGASFL